MHFVGRYSDNVHLLFCILEQRFNATDPTKLGSIIGWSFLFLTAQELYSQSSYWNHSQKIGKVKTQVLAVASMSLGYLLIFFVRQVNGNDVCAICTA